VDQVRVADDRRTRDGSAFELTRSRAGRCAWMVAADVFKATDGGRPTPRSRFWGKHFDCPRRPAAKHPNLTQTTVYYRFMLCSPLWQDTVRMRTMPTTCDGDEDATGKRLTGNDQMSAPSLRHVVGDRKVEERLTSQGCPCRRTVSRPWHIAPLKGDIVGLKVRKGEKA